MTKIMKLTLCAALLETLAVSAAQFSIGNIPIKTIVVPEKAPYTVTFAANELRDFVAKCNGTELKITSTPTEKEGNIFLGANDELLRGVPQQGFRIISRDGNLHISGHDSPNGVIYGLRNPWNHNEVYSPKLKLGAFGSCGTLQGVYYFLEKFGGVRFFWPGDVGTVIPDKHAIVLDNVKEMQYPRFHYRHPWFCNFDQVTDEVLWYKRLGLGGDAPVQIIDYFMCITSVLKNSHPEFFALVDGKRDFNDLCAIRGGGHLCFNAPGVKEAVADIIIDYFNKHPEQNTFPLTPGDGLRRCCECPQCKAEYENDPKGPGHFSNHIWRFVNDVAGIVGKKCPGKIVGCLAYEQYRDAPSRIARLNPNVGVMLCYDRSQMASPTYAAAIYKTVDEWNKRTDRGLYSWNWYLQGWLPWRQFPVIYSRTIQKDLQYMMKHGFSGEFIESETWNDNKEPHKLIYPGTLHLNLYVTAKLYWNPDLDLNALMDDYCRSFYGPAASEMRQFFAIAESCWEKGNAAVSKTSGVQSSVKTDAVFDSESLDKLYSLLQTAISKVPANSPFAARLKTIDGEFSHARASLIAMLRTEKPTLKSLHTNNAMTIDGILNEPSWRLGEGSYMVKKNGEPAPVNTQFYSRNDGKYLYFAFILGEKKLDKLYTKAKNGESTIWQDDCVEIFIKMGDTEKGGHIQYDVNAAGQLTVFLNADDGYTANISSSSKAKAAAGRGKNRWTVEIAIPLEELHLKPGDSTRANFFRCRMVDETQTFSTWSPAFTERHFVPEYFGTLTIE